MRRLGNNELLIRLASGGAANVFLVRDLTSPPPGRLLALKVLLPQLASNEDFLRMFFTEAKIAALLHHPNVVQIAGFGQVDGIHSLAMEFVFGASLSQVLRASARARKPLTVGVLLRITAQVCDALHYAHELQDEDGNPMGLVHRDVTPQNILIGFNGVPKLTDFGIAKATNRGWETQAGIVKGKFSYMSPEQALGKKVDRRSDIFCTGIVLWEALTGRELFKGSTPLEVIQAIRKQTIPPPSQVVEGLSPIVDPIVMKALRRSPKHRYQSALEMRHDIEKLIDRAGVKIDSKTISAEFAEIFGDVIVDRAFALRAAMAGRADLDELARAMSGQKLREDYLPAGTAGVNDPDPLGLFSEPTPISESSLDDIAGPAMPAIIEEPLKDVEADFIRPEPTAEESTAADEEDIARLEAEIDESIGGEDTSPVSGWNDGTRMMVPDDDLLNLLSEEDATMGQVPEEFKERFGDMLPPSMMIDDDDMTRADDGPPSFEDDEVTVDASRVRHELIAGVRNAQDPVAPKANLRIFDNDQLQSRVIKNDSGSRAGPARGAKRGRPVPRAPSLDMPTEDEATPIPDLEISGPTPGALDSRPPPPGPPPPPPSTRLAPGSSSLRASPMNDEPVQPRDLEPPPEMRSDLDRPKSALGSQRPVSALESLSGDRNGSIPRSKSAELSADSLRELAEQAKDTAPPQPPAPYGVPPSSSSFPRMMPGQSSPGTPLPPYQPPGYMTSGQHPGMQGPPHGSLIVQHKRGVQVRPILLVMVSILLVVFGALLGVLLMKMVFGMGPFS